MAGLLSDVLPWVYSQSDRMKRNLSGLLSDPAGSVEQTLGLLSDAGVRQKQAMDQAFADPKQPFRVTDQNALMQAVGGVMNGAMGFAPVGMTKAPSAAYTGPTMQEIAALQNVPTVEVMRRAMDAVGPEEFERQARAYIHQMSSGGKFSFPEQIGVEATARRIVALSQRK